MQLVNGTQFLNITPLFVPSNCFASSLAPDPVIVIVPLTTIYASMHHYNHITLTLKF